MSGLPGKNLINVEWYIASMLLALCILYPLCKKYYSFFIRIIAPVTSYIIIGYLIREIGYLGKPKAFLGFTYAGNIRAVGILCLGMFCFEIIRCAKNNVIVVLPKWILSLIELSCYGLVFYYMIADTFPKEYGGTMVYILCVAVGLSFSELTWGNKFFNNRFFYFLGELSLPVFLSQNLVRSIIKRYFSDYQFRYILLGELILSLVLSLILMFMVRQISKFMNNKKKVIA